MANRMILNETAWFGRGAVGALTDEVKRRGYQKALIVTDKTLVQCGVVAKVTDKMDAAGLAWAIYDGVVPNPTFENPIPATYCPSAISSPASLSPATDPRSAPAMISIALMCSASVSAHAPRVIYPSIA